MSRIAKSSHVVFLIAFLMLGAADLAAPDFKRLIPSGAEMKNGIYDVSAEYDDNGVGWISYSQVTLPAFVSTHIARSADHGAHWEFVSAVNESTNGVMRKNGVDIPGAWRNETSSLLYDRTDRAGRRWKLFSERYFAKPPYKPGDSFFPDGWIEYRYARSPEGPWSDPVRLFGRSEDGCRIDLNGLSPALRGYLFYNEAGSLCKDGVIYLSLDASTTATGLGDWQKRKIVLVASSDHGASWSYLGDLTTYEDAKALGYLVLTGSSLAEENGRLFALMTPSGATGLLAKNRGHDGVVVFEFEDIAHAKLKRRGDGALTAVRRLPIMPGAANGGLCDYDEKNSAGGILFCNIVIGDGMDVFRMFTTGAGIMPCE